MKILAVVANNRKHAFEVRTCRGTLTFPYAKVTPAPDGNKRSDRRCVCRSGAWGEKASHTSSPRVRREASISIRFWSTTKIPPTWQNSTMYRLTQEAKDLWFEASERSARDVARWLGTSPTQLYRLLDPTNYAKSLRQLISLLYLLGAEVEVEVKDRPRRRAG